MLCGQELSGGTFEHVRSDQTADGGLQWRMVLRSRCRAALTNTDSRWKGCAIKAQSKLARFIAGGMPAPRSCGIRIFICARPACGGRFGFVLVRRPDHIGIQTVTALLNWLRAANLSWQAITPHASAPGQCTICSAWDGREARQSLHPNQADSMMGFALG